MTLVRDFNLFPVPERLLNLERKYGDSLNYEDLYGVPQKPKKRRVPGIDDTISMLGSNGGVTAYGDQTHMGVDQ